MVKVCDAIMGTGKTSAAINYIKSHPEKRFIFITPYLEEGARIKRSCPDSKFVEPSDKLEKFHFKKSLHTAALIEAGCNISTTHQAFKHYTNHMLDMIREKHYTLIIDENIEFLEKYTLYSDDFELLLDGGYFEERDGEYCLTDKKYKGSAFWELFRFAESRNLIRTDVGRGTDNRLQCFYYWILPPDLINSFEDVFVLTYMFEGQSIHHFLESYNIPYTYVGIEKLGDNTYKFSDSSNYIPEYVANLSKLIKIVDHQKLNSIGDDRCALSSTWFKDIGNKDKIEQLRKHIVNYFYQISESSGDKDSSKHRLWSVYNDSVNVMKGKGYTKSFLTFNARATNNYRDRDTLVYIPNVFMHPAEKILYNSKGIDVNEDMYALSIMVQWIWRSAIRDGHPIEIYIPSRRMRTLLENWIKDVSGERG